MGIMIKTNSKYFQKDKSRIWLLGFIPVVLEASVVSVTFFFKLWSPPNTFAIKFYIYTYIYVYLYICICRETKKIIMDIVPTGLKGRIAPENGA